MSFEEKEHMGYVNIISSTEEGSSAIGPSDTRCLNLEDHELVKDYIIRYMQPVEHRDEARKTWEEIELRLETQINAFLQHYAIQKFSYHNDKKQGISVCQSIQDHTKGQRVDELLEDIRIKSIYYARILDPNTGDQVENEIFSFFTQHLVKQFHPLILSLRHQYEKGNISLEKYHLTLKFLYCFFVCYNIIGDRKIKKINDIVYEQAFLLESDFCPQQIDNCLSSLKSKLPSLNSFKNSLKQMRYSKHWSMISVRKKHCQLILRLVEEHLSKQKINTEVTIEHILPDCDSIDNAQIGNLVYLERHLNEECAAKPLAEKYDIYNRSMLMCPKEIAQHYRGKEFSPCDRADHLAELLYNEIFSFGEKT